MTPNANWNNITPTGAVTHFSVDQEGQLWGTGFDGNLYSAYPYNAWVMH